MDRGTFGTSRTIILQGDVDDSMVETLATHLTKLSSLAPHKPIVVCINSLGGCLTDGIAIVEMMKNSPSEIYLVANGVAYSAAAMILTLGPKGRRFATENTSMMYHEGKIEGMVSDSTKNLRGFVDFNQKLDRKMWEECCKRLKKSAGAKKLTERIYTKQEEIYFMAREALKWGVIDKIWTKRIWSNIMKEITAGNKDHLGGAGEGGTVQGS